MQTVSLKPALARLGVQSETITSGDKKGASSLFTELTKPQRDMFQNMVDDFFKRFKRVVRKARPSLTGDRLDEVTDGRVVSGTRARKLKLVDATGDLHAAFASAKQQAGIEQADLVLYHRPSQYVGSAYARHTRVPAGGTQVNLAQVNLGGLTGLPMPVGFYYLWRPAAP